jgi:chromatin remodeling complex protein RSC6
MPTKKSTVPKNHKKTTPKKAQKPVVETPVPVETVDVAPVETPIETTSDPVNTSGNNVKAAPNLLDYEDEMVVLQNQLRDAMALVKTAMTGLTNLQKKVAREKKVVDRKMKGKVKKEKDPNAPPTGFEKPVNVSPELGNFLGLKKGEQISRANVTSKVSAYCKEGGLQKKTDGRYIFPDEKLAKLLNIQSNSEITFFDIQKFLKPHYPDTVAKQAAAAAASK